MVPQAPRGTAARQARGQRGALPPVAARERRDTPPEAAAAVRRAAVARPGPRAPMDSDPCGASNPGVVPLPTIGSGTFNVTTYGAVDDGKTDNTTAIQAALTAAASGGRRHGRRPVRDVSLGPDRHRQRHAPRSSRRAPMLQDVADGELPVRARPAFITVRRHLARHRASPARAPSTVRDRPGGTPSPPTRRSRARRRSASAR